MNTQKRKPNRLKDYNYQSSGYYFITICTVQKQNFFWESDSLQNGIPVLSFAGKITEYYIREIPKHYSFIRLDQYAVMPNHIHLILQQMEHCSKGNDSISTVIGQLKRNISMQLPFPVWQKSFHDHIIRGEVDYQKIWNYVADNPRQWTNDCFYVDI